MNKQQKMTIQKDLDVFLKLCRKAQELIFENLKEYRTSHILSIFSLEEELIEMTPIEQIFYLGNYLNSAAGGNIFLEIIPQKEIYIKNENKEYRADFYIDTFVNKNGEEFALKKPIIIELDGFQYHNTKKQVNYDYHRENTLKTNGFDVIRFTGSQIYNDVYSCLNTVVNYIKNNI